MQRQWRSPWSPPVGPTSSWQCKTESCAPPGWQSRLCFCPGHSPLYLLPNARLPHGCIPTCPSFCQIFCMLSRASVRLYKAFFSSLVFKVGGWGKIPQNQRQGHFWAFYFYMRFKMAAAGAIFLFLPLFLYLANLLLTDY